MNSTPKTKAEPNPTKSEETKNEEVMPKSSVEPLKEGSEKKKKKKNKKKKKLE
jgi:hypothetical protein